MTDEKDEINKLKEKMWQRSYYVIFRALVDPSRIPPVMLEHYQWIIGLEKADKVLLSGPLYKKSDGPGVGMTVLRVDSFEDAEAIAATDPFVIAGAMTFEIERWQINEGRVNMSIDFSDQTFSAS